MVYFLVIAAVTSSSIIAIVLNSGKKIFVVIATVALIASQF